MEYRLHARKSYNDFGPFITGLAGAGETAIFAQPPGWSVTRPCAKRKESPVRYITLTTTAAALLLAAAVAAQQPTMPTQPRTGSTDRPDYPEVFYLHGAVGVGLSVFQSDDAKTTLRDQFSEPIKITSLGLDLAYGLKAGYRNILQAEYRIEKGIGQKLYWDAADGTNAGTRVEVEANLDAKEWLLKVNPAFPWVPPYLGVYLVYGQGEPEYFGDLGIRFEDGEKTIFGFEVTRLWRWYAASVSFEYHDLSFGLYDDETSVPMSGTWDGTYWLLQGSFSAGFGE